MCFLFSLNDAQSAYSSSCRCAPGSGIEITLKKTLLQAAVHRIDEPGELLKSAAVCCRRWGHASVWWGSQGQWREESPIHISMCIKQALRPTGEELWFRFKPQRKWRTLLLFSLSFGHLWGLLRFRLPLAKAAHPCPVPQAPPTAGCGLAKFRLDF